MQIVSFRPMAITHSKLNVCFNAWTNGIPNVLNEEEVLRVMFTIYALSINFSFFSVLEELW